MTPPLKSFLVVINKKWARILNRIHRRTQKALNLLKIRPTDLDTFLDCQTILIRLSVHLVYFPRFYIVQDPDGIVTTTSNLDNNESTPDQILCSQQCEALHKIASKLHQLENGQRKIRYRNKLITLTIAKSS